MPKQLNFNLPPDVPALEEEVQAFWRDTRAFAKSIQMRPENKAYVFYDGPPFATGMPHYGHLLASTTKDVIPRYWTMKGYRVNRIWGWDCHGLPIENMIEKQLDIKGGKKGIEELGIDRFNQACRIEVLRLDKEWEKIIDRLGRWVDFEHNYKTMDMTYMESVWWGFKQLYNKDLVYEGKKVILYCPRCATPLSNFEIAMDNSYQKVGDVGTTYKYKLTNQENTYLLAWSTTPWNKLATPALAVNPHLTYVKVKQHGEYYIVAKTLLNHLTDDHYEIVTEMTGVDLAKFTFDVHFSFYPPQAGEQSGVIIADEFVTAEEGTGVVTLAVYGEDDYRVMKKHGIQLIEHVDEEGKLKPEVTPWAGLPILKANPLIDEQLKERGLIYKQSKHVHSVPTCYRCNTRLYYAPLPAWFIDIQGLKSELVAQNQHINWYPDHLKYGRFGQGLENAPDWNISRSRYWGTPMPIWTDQSKKHTRVVGSVEELKAWAVNPQEVAQLTDIHREFIDDLEVWVDDAKTIKGKRLPEVFDCWVESGSMPFASIHYPFTNKEFFDANYPAQFISEYIAQTRAWFYTMHVMSVGIFGSHAFENALTTGTILAEDGSKMSKSKKNYPDPMVLINTYGVDSLRLYLMSSTVMKGENLNFNEREVSDIRRKVFVIWWNVVAFYQQYADHSVGHSCPNFRPDHVMDTWLLARVQQLIDQVTKYMDAYDVVRASRTLMTFVDELSTWYLRLSRTRIREENNAQASQVFGYAIYTLAQLFAPLCPFFVEVIHHAMVDSETSIHHSDWPQAQSQHVAETLTQEMQLLRDVVTEAHATRRDSGIKLRQPLASLTISAPVDRPSQALLDIVAQETNVKRVIWEKSATAGVTFDTRLTPELQAEGEARELIRSIQQLRKSAKLNPTDVVEVQAPQWPTLWQAEIQRQTNVHLHQGPELKLLQS